MDGSQTSVVKRNKLRDCSVLCLVVFLVSLLLFSAALPKFGLYLSVLCTAEWLCILLYRRRGNRQFFFRVFFIGLGNILAFTLHWLLVGREISLANIGILEIILLVLLCIGVVFIVLASDKPAKESQAMNAKAGTPRLFPEREHDLQRLEGFLQRNTQLIGIDARWGDGKTFLIDRLCASPQISDRYEIVRINVLAGNEDEVELALMNEFDRILRRNRIFSLASKQMLKLLESNDTLKQLQWLLIQDTQSVSTTFSNVLDDLEKLDKNVLIIVDDIERLGDNTLIRKLFALMESVSSDKVQIIYLFNSLMLTGFDRSYLEKYIPCYMTLTPVRFASIVRSLWDELQMDVTGLECKNVAGLVEFPKGSTSILQILALEPGGLRPFRLDNITVRRTRVFLEEFRNLVMMKTAPEDGTTPVISAAERELFLKCLFIKHFLHDGFEKFVIGTRIADSPLFQLSEEAKTFLERLDLPAPDSMTLLDLLGIRRQLHCAKDMQCFTEKILADRANYNCLAALSMLHFDYTDVWQEIQKAERPGTKQVSSSTAASGQDMLDPFRMRAEQIGNEDISAITRERNNEQIDRVMWNLLANGSSELANIDAYVKHFQEIVLTAESDAQQKAWQRFSEDAYQGRIYKNNVTRSRIGIDAYLPLFQGFRVTNASPGEWLKLLDFYFSPHSGNDNSISVEMLQNLNYVDMTDRRVYVAVLEFFTQCRIVGNLNSEPCMYRFLKQTLSLAQTLGYTKNHLFHDVWYGIVEPQGEDGLLPSQQWQDAVLALAKQFEAMKCGLEESKLADPRLQWFNSDIDVIIRFINQCKVLIAKEETIKMRTLHIDVKESSRSRHQELCDALKEELQSGIDTDTWIKEIKAAYADGQLDPLEIRNLFDQIS